MGDGRLPDTSSGKERERAGCPEIKIEKHFEILPEYFFMTVIADRVCNLPQLL